MEKYHIGLDFGTSQTKICLTRMDLSETDKTYSFIKFKKNNKYFLPSTIKISDNYKIKFGEEGKDLIRYFKMKSLYDENPLYSCEFSEELICNDLKSFPEICCILYLTYCILEISENINYKSKSNKNGDETQKNGNFFRNLFGKKDEIKKNNYVEKENFEFFYTIGIPTEYDNTKENYSRRCKQYEIFYIALQISKYFIDILDFNEKGLNEMLDLIRIEFEKLKSETKNINQEFYESFGIFVLAETTAGIIPLRNQLQKTLDVIPENNIISYEKFRKSNLGNYITMDIGAGTTDISFFELWEHNGIIKMKYFASKSIDLASNSLILNYLNSNNLDLISTFEFENINNQKWDSAQKNIKEKLFNLIRIKESDLYYKVQYFFNNAPRQYWHYEFNKAKGCKVYGGGSRFKEFSEGELMLHNGGSNSKALATITLLSKFINANEIRNNVKLSNINGTELNQSDRNLIINNFDLLNIAYGLSQLDFKNRPDGENGWLSLKKIEKDYIETGMAIYDIYDRDWVKA